MKVTILSLLLLTVTSPAAGMMLHAMGSVRIAVLQTSDTDRSVSPRTQRDQPQSFPIQREGRPVTKSAGNGGEGTEKGEELTFNWPKTLRGNVRYTHENSTDGKMIFREQGSYDLSVAPDREGLVVRHANVRMKVTWHEDNEQGDTGEEDGYRPDVIINTSGELIRIDKLDEMYVAFIRGLKERNEKRGTRPDAAIKVLSAMERFFSREQMETMITETWNRVVGNWPGMPLRKGETYEQSVDNFLPTVGRDVPAKISVSFIDWVPCGGAQKDNRCAEMEMRMTLDPAPSKTGAGDLMDTAAPHAAGIDLNVGKMQVEEVIRLITEPGTLVPHRMDYTKTTDVHVSTEGKTLTSKRVEKIQEVYCYTEAASRPALRTATH